LLLGGDLELLESAAAREGGFAQTRLEMKVAGYAVILQ
jgi:hypothetical protein